ncbi:MAG TPA: hypothetical protein VMF69_16540 [Gemmataceae bacterium]|nr:hypothetical protein [Gemmataceae bacterium]
MRSLIPDDVGTTLLLPMLSGPDAEDAWRVFLGRYGPLIVEWAKQGGTCTEKGTAYTCDPSWRKSTLSPFSFLSQEGYRDSGRSGRLVPGKPPPVAFGLLGRFVGPLGIVSVTSVRLHHLRGSPCA